MKVLALAADSGGCGFYRIREPARVVGDQFEIDIEVRDEIYLDATKSLDTGEHIIHEVQEDVDLIVAQRPLNHGVVRALEQAQKQGIAVVVELDDDFHSIHPNNMAWKATHPEFSPFSNYEWLLRGSTLADWVTVSTPALTKYAPHGRVSVIRNCVPESIFDVSPMPGPKGVGWTGTVSTHPEDLEVTSGAIGRAVRKTKSSVHIVGDGVGVSSALELPSETLVHVSGWKPLDEYYQTIANMISVGIVPLEDSPFNQAKSNLKGLEMAALGIPFVASPTSEYVRLSDQKVGSLAHDSLDWYKQVSALISNGQKRTSLGQKYQNMVREHYVYERSAHEWFNVWQQAVAHRKSLGSVLR